MEACLRQIATISDEESRKLIIRLIEQAPLEQRIEFLGDKRTKAQNAVMWRKLSDIAKQVIWYGEYLSKEDWKDIFTASLLELRVVPGLDGRKLVILGLHSSTLNKEQFSDLLTLIDAFAAEKNVIWSATKQEEEMLKEIGR